MGVHFILEYFVTVGGGGTKFPIGMLNILGYFVWGYKIS